DLFGILGDVDPSELRVLGKVYSAGLDVNYKLLHHDLADGVFPAYSTNGANASPRAKRRGGNQYGITEADVIEGPLWEIAARDRIRIKNFVTDYDRMRSGMRIKAQFMRALKLHERVFSLCKLIDSPLRQNLVNTKFEMRLVLAFNKVFIPTVSAERELVKALEATISEAATTLIDFFDLDDIIDNNKTEADRKTHFNNNETEAGLIVAETLPSAATVGTASKKHTISSD
ncbi:hypothetical protein SPRG_17116, partial [Saprolegnia parasitica CBS 223.65]